MDILKEQIGLKTSHYLLSNANKHQVWPKILNHKKDIIQLDNSTTIQKTHASFYILFTYDANIKLNFT